MRILFAIALLVPVALTGCAAVTTPAGTEASGLQLQGMVHGGQQPISGAHVYLMAANTTGYGSASVSLLKASSTGNSDSVGAYVLTGSNGSFTITGDYTCTPNTQVYTYVLGGNPGAGTNPSAGLMAVLGNCPSTGTSASTTPYIWVNEVSTVAAAYSMAGFAVDALHVSSSGTSAAKTGIANAFANAASLAGLSTGVATTTNPTATATAPQKEINTLANILASCVNSNGAVTGPTSPTNCYTLFTDTSSFGAIPTDTATAAIYIAQNPGSNVAALYNLPTAAAAFAPALTAQPNDFTVALTFNTNISAPGQIAIDATGNAWVACSSSVVFIPNAASTVPQLLLPASDGFSSVSSVAIDLTGNAWVVNNSTEGFTVISSSFSVLTSANQSGGAQVLDALGVAIDPSNNAWIGSQYEFGSRVAELSQSYAVLSGSSGYTGGGLSDPYAIAFDSSGNAYVANYGGGALSRITPAGVPTAESGGGLNQSTSVALDSLGAVWVSNDAANAGVTKLTFFGSAHSATNFASGLFQPQSIAVDGSANVWVNNYGATIRISELSNAGVPISPATGYVAPGGSLASYTSSGMAIDLSGNVWSAASGTNTVTELIGAATPILTPLALAAKNNMIATRP